jgi:hypothetical protein
VALYQLSYSCVQHEKLLTGREVVNDPLPLAREVESARAWVSAASGCHWLPSGAEGGPNPENPQDRWPENGSYVGLEWTTEVVPISERVKRTLGSPEGLDELLADVELFCARIGNHPELAEPTRENTAAGLQCAYAVVTTTS